MVPHFGSVGAEVNLAFTYTPRLTQPVAANDNPENMARTPRGNLCGRTKGGGAFGEAALGNLLRSSRHPSPCPVQGCAR